MKPSRDSAGQPVDLTNCEREPIHIPGHVQDHGVLFALSEPDLAVLQVSANVPELVGASPEELLGTGFDRLIDPSQRDQVRDWLRSPDVHEANPVRLRAGAEASRATFDGLAHRRDGALIVELEGRRAEEDGPPPDYSRPIRKAMARLQAARDLGDFCRVAAAEVRALTGFDRVIVYRFDPEWNGEVFAEDRREGLAPLLGLHFPASDIPEPARRLYHLNRIRLIADVQSRPVPLVPELHPTTGRPLDLSLSALRSVSPVHIQYLKNMGAYTSMSISLMRGDRLWGLLSCMHYSGPRPVPAALRDACEFLGVLVSVQLAVKEDSEGFEYRARLQAVRERLLQRMSEETDLVRGLMGGGPDLLELTGARGAAVVHDDTCAVVGTAPDEAQIKRLVAWLRVHADGEVFATDSLPRLLPEAAEYKDVAAGLVAIATSQVQGHYVLWFRPEVIQTVDWGGDPTKPVAAQAPGGRLTPRTSFELWKEVVHRKSLPWQPWEVEAARALRDAILAVVVRRAEELTRLNAELERSNSDLDAFAFTTSHDMKEPLRGIHNYASFLMEDYADKLDAEGVHRLETLVRLSQRMEDVVESMLQFSRLGRAELSCRPTDLNDVVGEVLDLHRMMLEENRVEVRIPRPLPVVLCDRVQAGQMLGNLITNAVKYNDKPRKWVEIGYEEPMASADGAPAGDAGRPRPPVFFVRDNGIGIPERHRHAIFRLFKRLHGREKFGGGTGAGLTFAKKIAERHGGSLWVESEPGVGSTFHFTLGR